MPQRETKETTGCRGTSPTTHQNQRLDPAFYASTDHIVFITVCTFNRRQAFVRPDLNQLVVDELRALQERYHCSVYTYCLMLDHLHYLVRPTQDGVSVLTFANRLARAVQPIKAGRSDGRQTMAARLLGPHRSHRGKPARDRPVHSGQPSPQGRGGACRRLALEWSRMNPLPL